MSLPTQTELQILLDYDPLTGQLWWKHRPRFMFPTDRAFNTWNARYAGKPAFTAVDRKGYNVGAIYDINYRASRIIYKREHGIEPDQVDHEDGNTLNNRLINLRDVSGQDNQKNMKTPTTNTSGVIGVSFNSGKKKWMAAIGSRKTYKRIYCSSFEEAVAVRKQLEIDHGYHPNHGR